MMSPRQLPVAAKSDASRDLYDVAGETKVAEGAANGFEERGWTLAGAQHCGWQSAMFLTLAPTGHRHRHRLPVNGRQLWLAEDRSAACVVTAKGTERWPAAKHLIACD